MRVFHIWPAGLNVTAATCSVRMSCTLRFHQTVEVRAPHRACSSAASSTLQQASSRCSAMARRHVTSTAWSLAPSCSLVCSWSPRARRCYRLSWAAPPPPYLSPPPSCRTVTNMLFPRCHHDSRSRFSRCAINSINVINY